MDKLVTKEQKLNLLNRVVTIFDKNKVDYAIYYGTLLGAMRNNDFIPWDSDIDLMVYDVEKINSLKKEFEKQGLKCIPTQNNTISFIDAELCKEIDFRVWADAFVNDNGELFVMIDKNINKKDNITSSSTLFYILGFPYLVLNGEPLKTKSFSYNQMQLMTSMANKIPTKIRDSVSKIFMKIQSVTMAMHYINIPPLFDISKRKLCNIKVSIPNNPEKHLEIFYGRNWRTPDKNWTTFKDNRKKDEWKTVIRNNKEFLYYLPLLEEVKK